MKSYKFKKCSALNSKFILLFPNFKRYNTLAISGPLGNTNSAPNVQARWPPVKRVLPPRQSSLPSAPGSSLMANPNSASKYLQLSSASSSRLAFCNLKSQSRSPLALSINEEGEDFMEDVLDDRRRRETDENCRNALHHQQSSRPYRLRRQVIKKPPIIYRFKLSDLILTLGYNS